MTLCTRKPPASNPEMAEDSTEGIGFPAPRLKLPIPPGSDAVRETENNIDSLTGNPIFGFETRQRPGYQGIPRTSGRDEGAPENAPIVGSAGHSCHVSVVAGQ